MKTQSESDLNISTAQLTKVLTEYMPKVTFEAGKRVARVSFWKCIKILLFKSPNCAERHYC